MKRVAWASDFASLGKGKMCGEGKADDSRAPRGIKYREDQLTDVYLAGFGWQRSAMPCLAVDSRAGRDVIARTFPSPDETPFFEQVVRA
jgi:hypothetical protein